MISISRLLIDALDFDLREINHFAIFISMIPYFSTLPVILWRQLLHYFCTDLKTIFPSWESFDYLGLFIHNNGWLYVNNSFTYAKLALLR